MSHSVIGRPQPMCLPTTRADFYREEFLKHKQCLRHHKEYYSERAIRDVEAALTRILGQIEHLTSTADADEVISQLLRQFDLLTRLSAWSDSTHVH